MAIVSGENHKSIFGRNVGLDEAGRLVARDYADDGNGVKVIARKLYAATAASTAISNTASETAFDKYYTIPANMLQVGSLLRIRYQGIQTAQNSTNTLALKLYLGGLTGTALQSIAAAQGAQNNIFAGEAYVAIRTIGASGTFVAWGQYTAVPAASASATNVVSITASTTIDTTASQDIKVSATWSAASSSNSVRLDYLSVEAL